MDIEHSIGLEWCFGIFSGFSFLGAIFVYLFVPETRAKSMEDIQNYFRKKGKGEKLFTKRKIGQDYSIPYHATGHHRNNCINRNDVSTRF
jgi:hypothetical protein